MKPGVLDRTEANLEVLARRLKEVGIPGLQVLEVNGLAPEGTNGDRRTFNITGTKIIVPPPFFSQVYIYNNNEQFGICLNEDGEDTDSWFDFTILLAAYRDVWPIIENVLFHKITIRNYATVEAELIKIWIFQDPLWVNQVNAMLKDITQ